jgi:hypothetical protein
VPSLREIQQGVATLWANQEARTWLVKRKGKRPDCLRDVPPEILESVDRKGVELYAELLHFGHHDVMDSIYPYCAQLLSTQWPAIVDDYLLRFPPDHYNFNRLCSRLPAYFTTYGGKYTLKFPFLSELADYEWIELEKIEQDEQIDSEPHTQLSDPAQFVTLSPLLNPTVTMRDYRFNILSIARRLEQGKKLGKVEPERTLVAIYRQPQTHLCKFVELGEAAASIVEATRAGDKTYQQLLPLALALVPDTEPQQAVTDFLELIEELQELGIFVGDRINC